MFSVIYSAVKSSACQVPSTLLFLDDNISYNTQMKFI